MKTNYDVAIIGGGIIGCSIAYYLTKENMDVAIFEEKQIASRSTRAAAGMLGAHSECNDLEVFYPFARSSQLMYFQLQDELKELSGVDIELRKGGILQLAYSEYEKSELSTTLSLPTVSWYDNKSVRNMENAVSADIFGAAYIEDDVNVLPYSTCLAFSKSAQVLDASIFLNIRPFLLFKKKIVLTYLKLIKVLSKLRLSSLPMVYGAQTCSISLVYIIPFPLSKVSASLFPVNSHF